MALNDWIGAFGRAEALDLTNQLERGYEAALLIQSIELEHYNDRPVRPELDLRLPAATQASILRRVKAALQVRRQVFWCGCVHVECSRGGRCKLSGLLTVRAGRPGPPLTWVWATPQC